jgi:hypothetical protein
VYRDMLAWLTQELDLETEPVVKGARTGP